MVGYAPRGPMLGANPQLGGQPSWQWGQTPQWVPDWLRNLSAANTAQTQATQQSLAALPPRYAMTPQDINTAMSLGMSAGTLGEGGGLKADVPDWIKRLPNRQGPQTIVPDVTVQAPELAQPKPFENPYQDSPMRTAWDAGHQKAGKRYANRASNPYFDPGLTQAWNDGFDARLAARAAKRAAK